MSSSHRLAFGEEEEEEEEDGKWVNTEACMGTAYPLLRRPAALASHQRYGGN